MRRITFKDLLTQRSGLTYGDWHPGPIAQAYKDALGGDIDSEVPPGDGITRLAALPLLDQPGMAFHYGHSTDLLGLLIARMENAPLGDVLKRRIFDPLGMNDTGFTVPFEKKQRRAGTYGFDMLGNYVSVSRVRVTRSCLNGLKTRLMSLSGKGFGLRWTFILLSRRCS